MSFNNFCCAFNPFTIFNQQYKKLTWQGGRTNTNILVYNQILNDQIQSFWSVCRDSCKLLDHRSSVNSTPQLHPL